MPEETVALTIRVLVAEDTPLHTQLLAEALRREDGFEVIGSDGQVLVARVDLRNIDVFLISSDLDERPAHGFEVLRKVRALHPDARAVMLLDSQIHKDVLEAFCAGSRGVLGRRESIETLVKCVRRVHQGQIWANSQQMSLLVQSLVSSYNLRAINTQGMEHLSRREVEIVESVAQGLSNRKIADRLGLSQHTVKNYLFRVFEKLGVSSRVELLSMTLSRMRPLESSGSSRTNSLGFLDDSILAGCQKAAEQGAVIEQLRLARFYWTRRADSNDITQAYKWYLIVRQQVSRAGKSIGKAMTMEQIFQAEQMAAEWLKKAQEPLPDPSREELIIPLAPRRTRPPASFPGTLAR